ncbi:MAG: hypothetical protein GY762_18030 [Proteobacteria bacterium]|nr:hypothetical protein [Pseudomonadota bacterium]
MRSEFIVLTLFMAEADHLAGCPDQLHIRLTVRQQVMSALALLFLIVTAFTLHHIEKDPLNVELNQTLKWLFLLIWLPMLVEAAEGFWRQGDYSSRSVMRLLLLCLVPPYRLALSPYPASSCVWFPKLGWRRVDDSFYEELDRAFSIPMLLMALLILPILAVEIFWAKQAQSYPAIMIALDSCIVLIWLAFTIEFIVMSTVAKNKLTYVVRHWINLVIILLPLLAFLRGIWFLRALRLGKVGKALKVYRLRGLGMRAWQGIVVLELIELVLYRDPEARLAHRKKKLEKQDQEMARLRGRIKKLEAEIIASKETGEDK